jgi:hypothetical protein
MINKNWKEYWKLVARAKSVTSEHMAQYCILKALTAKSQNKVQIAESLLRNAFTPVVKDSKLCNGRTKYDVLSWYPANRAFRTPTEIFGLDITLLMDAEGVKEYTNLASQLNFRNIRANEPEYMFLFVRQDISPEQQAVQAAHAAFKAGTNITDNASGLADKTNFVLVGVQNEYRLKEVVNVLDGNKDCSYVVFNEPDLDNAMTAIATKPMKAHKKRFLRQYQTLTF